MSKESVLTNSSVFLDDRCLKSDFEKACDKVKELSGNLTTEQLMFFYARYKQTVNGPCNISKPSIFDFQGGRKWTAWKSLGNATSEEAMVEYIDELKRIDPEWDTKEEVSKPKKIFGPVQSVMLNTDAPLSDDEKTVFDFVKECDITKLTACLKTIDINQKDDDGLTLLHWASDHCYLDIVHILLEHGADINSQDNEGQTPLHFAYFCDHKEVVDILLASGADASIRDHEGNIAGKA